MRGPSLAGDRYSSSLLQQEGAGQVGAAAVLGPGRIMAALGSGD